MVSKSQVSRLSWRVDRYGRGEEGGKETEKGRCRKLELMNSHYQKGGGEDDDIISWLFLMLFSNLVVFGS